LTLCFALPLAWLNFQEGVDEIRLIASRMGRGSRMLKHIIDTVNSITRLSGILAGLILSALMLLNTYAVVSRYMFHRPVDWILDVSEFLMVGAVFLGTAYILQVEGHVRVDLVVHRLPEKIRRGLYLVTTFMILFFTIFLVWKTWELAWDNLYTRSDSVVRFPLFPGYILVFYGSFLLLLQSIIKLYSRLRG
jgi:TRAP-type C4-dicarboxylate transport system permease small subunit